MRPTNLLSAGGWSRRTIEISGTAPSSSIVSLGLISLLDPAPQQQQLVASAQPQRDWISVSDLPSVGVDGTLPGDRPVEWISIADLPLVPIDQDLVERAAAQTLSQRVEGVRFAGPGVLGIPAPMLAAYRSAEASLSVTDPGCRLPWWLLAGIGKIESNHARGGRVDATGRTNGKILGPRLDGSLANTPPPPTTDPTPTPTPTPTSDPTPTGDPTPDPTTSPTPTPTPTEPEPTPTEPQSTPTEPETTPAANLW